jgi:S-DNA-T family DNA segregation ATPase FtsK/SpoIIIE
MSKLRGMANTRKRAPARKPAARKTTAQRTRTSTRVRTGARSRSRLRHRRAGRRGRHFARGLGLTLPRGLPHLPELDQRQRDVVGLALLAVGIFMGFVLWGHWNGGHAGHGLAIGLGWTVGKARVLAPIALAGAGAALLLRPVWPALSPLRTGAICLSASIVLALAAGTLGVSSGAGGASSKGASWTSAFLQAHGGVAGEALYQGSHRLVQSVGVDILVVFLFLVGVILLTGASLASAIRATGSGVADTTRMLKAHRPRGAATEAPEAMPAAGSLQPPEPEPEELIVRATHVEAPSLDGAPATGERSWETDALEAERADEAGENPEGSFVNDLVGDAQADEASLNEASPKDEDEPSGVARTDPAVGEVDSGQLTPQGRLREAITDDPDFVWKLPPADELLARSTADQTKPDTAGQERTATSLTEALGHFGVQAKVIGTVAGPHITRYELRLAPGTKVGKVSQLKDDLAYALAATDIRILAPIPGKQAVGVEVPNAHRRIVKLGDIFQRPPKDWSPLTVWLGKDVAGNAIGADLAKMPHLLVAGTTGAGKSGAINAMLSSVLLRATPHEVRLVLVDPKQVELNHYESIPHLLTPVITSPRMAANALQNLVREMEQRYGIMSMARTRSLIELNKARAKRGEAPLPYILCVIDELADLMMVAPADVEDSIIRLAQKARAVGIHLVLATQSPRVDVITGMIKANVPSRIAFAVSSQTDSRVILDQNGAESLLGQGDMLFSPVGTSRLQRIQGAYIDEAQIAKLTDLWRRQGEPELREELLEEVEPAEVEASGDELDPDEDPMLRDAITLVAEMQTASTSMLQRRLRLGYTRAGRVIDMLERRGVISGYEGSKPRQVLITEADLPRILAALESSSSPSATVDVTTEA